MNEFHKHSFIFSILFLAVAIFFYVSQSAPLVKSPKEQYNVAGASVAAPVEIGSPTLADIAARKNTEAVHNIDIKTNVLKDNSQAGGDSSIQDQNQTNLGTDSSNSIQAASYLVKELGERDSNQLDSYANNLWPIASITKLMTATVAIEELDPNKFIIMSPSAIAAEGMAGGMSVGERYTLADLLKSMMMVSSNDASTAVSEELPNGEFIQKMNDKAKDLGMFDTNFVDPTGLSYLNQSTPEDLERLLIYIRSSHPEILVKSRLKTDFIIEQNSGDQRQLFSIIEFAGQPDFLGGKTGYIEAADGNFVSLFNYQGKTIMVLVLGSKDRFSDTEKLLAEYKNQFKND
ncbi:MAG: hypothetical protein COU09_03070 [Candidatus Harrisonbacteria bacterium CG10_big_fil_rev_8_21_14_0_10_44_23]|uniref:Peptidase S11 D-alanyl-D-alanine carboxypeptidase A N-terminal domain-containing protein n=1 Tax=Candidatus Harrisonbacteria bacterium CG10_big_fil_rev_8_21_14_0_10_44_23 TaxID=1974585 RepID=A0A2H0UPI8_9BACT|nr:MAG: hypothetical protein COU09_03070 [Candidatus Harrisonbacteria bacterium CG10_big_fil_rev_8_21_14_0_10_44_23]